MKQKLELISFNVCPFVQRSVITLLEKNIDFKLTYIDLNEPPAWFSEVSPLGKVPVLKVNDAVLFESAVINEYLDEVNLPRFHPNEALLRAQNRAWIEFGSDMIMTHYKMTTACDSESFLTNKSHLEQQFERLEKVFGKGPYFNGIDFSLVDAAFAPLLMRIDLLSDPYPLDLYSENSRIAQWVTALSKKSSVKNSVVSNFKEIYTHFVKSLESYYSAQIKVN